MKTPFSIVSLSALGALGGCQSLPDASAPGFRETVARHLAAVQSRDMEGVIGTITTGNDLVLIFPNGSRNSTRAEYLEFHREWFADTQWVMIVEPVHVREGRDYGYALYRSSYDPDGAGPKPANAAWLSLGFARENGAWRLVHDQNTRIVENAPQ